MKFYLISYFLFQLLRFPSTNNWTKCWQLGFMPGHHRAPSVVVSFSFSVMEATELEKSRGTLSFVLPCANGSELVKRYAGMISKAPVSQGVEHGTAASVRNAELYPHPRPTESKSAF